MAIVRWTAHNPILGTRQLAKVAPPPKSVTLAEWREEIKSHFPEYVSAAEACLSVVCQLLVQDVRNPFPLILVDRASSGKTVILNFFADIEEITFALDQFTPASFVTHIAGKTKKQLAEIDLMNVIKLKTLIVREMGTIFGENDDNLRQKISLLTRIFDGEGLKDWSGVYGKRGYSGDYNFMFLGATTPLPLRVWKLMTQFGHRFQFLSVGTKRKGVKELLAIRAGENYKVKEIKCRKMTEMLLRTLWTENKEAITWDKDKDDPKAMEWIAELAVFVAGFRGDIIAFEEWTETGKDISTSAPNLEDTPRLFTCLCNLAEGHAAADRRNYIIMDDLAPVLRVAMGSAPNPRPELWRALLQAAGRMDVRAVAAALQVSEKTARKEMHKMLKVGCCVGEVDQEKTEDDSGSYISYGQSKNYIDIHPDFSWWRSDEMAELLDRFEIIV